ncbi:MAG: LCP family protein [Turicibacter sp.]|nr:LCP family protein [Turicibacter sp.]
MQSNYSKKPRKNRRNRNAKSLFIKAFAIAFVVFSTLVAGVVSVNTFVITPPEIPSINPGLIAASPEDTEYERPASYDPEYTEEDWLIGGGLIAPAGFTNEDRKELFYTFLIMGLDEGINVDTIMVASYDGVNAKANIISIPRDSLVNVSRRVRKINVAFPAGYLRDGGRDGGIAQMQREIMSIIGFVPDFYVLIDLEAFVKMVDAVGGIEIEVPFHMRYDDPFQDLFIDIPEGLQHMDGETALQFARFRRGNTGFRSITDYQRIENQQKVISAMLSNLIQPASILRIPEFISIFSEHVHTDISLSDMMWFASQLTIVSGLESLSTHTIPTDGTSGAPRWYEFLHGPGIVEMVNQTINPFTIDIELSDLDIIREYN